MTPFLLPLEWACQGAETRLTLVSWLFWPFVSFTLIPVNLWNSSVCYRLTTTVLCLCVPTSRLKSSASSATVTSSSFTAQWSRLPTMESLPVRLFVCFICLTVGCCLMAVSRQKRRICLPRSQLVLAVTGAAVSIRVGICQRVQEGNTMML